MSTRQRPCSDGVYPPGRGKAALESPGGWMSLGSRVAALRAGKRGKLELRSEKEASWGHVGLVIWGRGCGLYFRYVATPCI